MKTTLKLSCLLFFAFAFITSCSNELVNKSENYAIKSIFAVAEGSTVAKFIYNEHNDIIEDQSFYFYNKYIYDDKRRLIQQESACDPDIASSTVHIKTELMTSQNSTFTGKYIFKYNTAGKLATQKNYFKKDNQFVYTSMLSYEYVGDKIVKCNLHNAEDAITQYYSYEYDSKGNVIKEKHYSFLAAVGTSPKLINEVSFKFDSMHNPFKIYTQLGQPGLHTNANNIIETNTVLYENVPGIDKFSTSTTTYEYNQQGYPVKVNNNDVYIYE